MFFGFAFRIYLRSSDILLRIGFGIVILSNWGSELE
jgi:hypothetical protein